MGKGLQPDGVGTYPASADDLAGYLRASDQLGEFRAPLLKGSEGEERLYVAAFDGTGNSMFKDAPANHTNVADVAKQIDALKDPDIGFGYVEGPGTQGGLDGLGDLMKGDSYRARMDEMYVQFVRQADAWLKENPGADIRVAAIGFADINPAACGLFAIGIHKPTEIKTLGCLHSHILLTVYSHGYGVGFFTQRVPYGDNRYGTSVDDGFAEGGFYQLISCQRPDGIVNGDHPIARKGIQAVCNGFGTGATTGYQLKFFRSNISKI